MLADGHSVGTEGRKNLKSEGEKSEQRTNNPLPRLLTVKGAGEYLGLSTWGIRERIWQGLLPVVTFPGGKKQYVDRNDLEAFILKNKRVME